VSLVVHLNHYFIANGSSKCPHRNVSSTATSANTQPTLSSLAGQRKRSLLAGRTGLLIHPVSWSRMFPSLRRETEIAAIMVQDIRKLTEDNFRYCSVCAMLASDRTNGHEAGVTCPTVPPEGADGDGWDTFKKRGFHLPGGTTRHNCLLPTVSFFLSLSSVKPSGTRNRM